MPQHNAYGDQIFFWIDDEGVRCSPRHRTLKAALNYAKDIEHYWVTDPETRRPQQLTRDRDDLPSQKQPQELRVAEYTERPLNGEEQGKVDQVRQLMAEGLV